MLERDAKAPTLHYTWIGPPPDNKGVRGHDVTCVKRMAEINQTNPIKFWCLEAQAQHYQDEFKSHPNVEVCAVEAQLREDSLYETQYQRYAQVIHELMRMVLSDERNTVRDRVTIKDAFVTYLLMRHGGYTVDTNIEPVPGANVQFPEHDVFKIARVHHVNHKDMDDAPECFLMYMPDNSYDKKKAQAVLNDYFTTAIKCEEERGRPGFDYEYTLGCCYILGLYNQKADFFMGDSYTRDARDVFFEELGVVKHYFNTHKAQYAKTDRPMIYSATLRGDLDRVAVMLNSGDDVNKAFSNDKVTNESLLHLAVRNQDGAMVALLIDAGANINAATHYDGEFKGITFNNELLTPLELAKKLNNQEIVAIFKEKAANALGLAARLEEPQAIRLHRECVAARQAVIAAFDDVIKELERTFTAADRGKFIQFDPMAYLKDERETSITISANEDNDYDRAVIAAVYLYDAYEKLTAFPETRMAAMILHDAITSEDFVRQLEPVGIHVDPGVITQAADGQTLLPTITHNIEEVIDTPFANVNRQLLRDHKNAIDEFQIEQSSGNRPKV